MKKIILIVMTVAVSVLVACDNGTNTINATNDSDQSASSEIVVPTQDVRPFTTTNNFSDKEWKNGVLQKDGRTNIFYILQLEKEPLKIKIGDSLVFAKTGEATVEKVAPMSLNGKISVFITLDKDIDPVGDGYPNKIYLAQ